MSTGDVVTTLRRIWVCPDDAKALHDTVERLLRDRGFDVRREVSVPSGRLDLVATKDGTSVAIELDRRSPREKSVRKLREFEGGRVIALRGVFDQPPPEGIDAVIGVPVRRAG